MIKRGLPIGNIGYGNKLLEVFAQAIELESISKYGKIINCSDPKEYLVLELNGTWFEITTKQGEISGSKLQKTTNRTSINEYTYDELLDHSIQDPEQEGIVYKGHLEGTLETHDCETLKVKCDNCNGNGICPNCLGKKIISCPQCDGSGDCPNCNGTGKVDCTVCDGSGDCNCCGGDGEEYCSWCDGDGEVDCDSCSGTGEFTLRSGRVVPCRDCNGSGTVTCDNCDGDGTVTCGACGGSGKCRRCDGRGDFYCRECYHHNGKCIECRGKGTITCPECEGKGKCHKCKGTGIMNCPRCDGSGKYQTFTEFSIRSHNKNWHIEDKVKIYDHPLSEFTGKVLYDDVWDRFNQIDVHERNISQIIRLFSKEQTEQILRAFDQVQKTSDQTLRPYEFSAKIIVIEDRTIKYEFGEKYYYFHIVGDNHDIVYDQIPKWRSRVWEKLKNIF